MKKLKKILLILVALFLLSGLLSSCGDLEDINKKSIVTAIALDKKNDEIYLYLEIANIEGANKSGGAGSKYISVKSVGKTFPEVWQNIRLQLDKTYYFGTIGTIILTEDFANEYLVEFLYRVRADEFRRKKATTVITKEDPSELLKVSNEKDVSVGFTIEKLLKTLEEEGESFSRTTARLLENLSNKYTGFLLPCIGLQGSENSLIGYSVVNGTTIDGFIPVAASKGTIFFKTDKPKFYYIVPYNKYKFTIEVSLKRRKINPSYENGKINFDMNFNFEAKLMYGDKKTPYNFDDAANAEVTQSLTEILKNELMDAVAQAQKKFKCDYLQFDDEFRIKFPVEFEKMDWQNEFKNASFNINVKVVLSDTWMMDYETKEQK